jgi:alginate O-acetyltransferase complex protein AlgI
MTMGRWFRDYVYLPLGGNRVPPVRAAFNILAVWTLFGLWHGAAWTFVLWGVYNGAIQAAYRELRRRGWLPPAFPGQRWAGALLNFVLLIPSALLFRSEGFAAGLDALGRVVTLDGAGAAVPAAWWWGLAALGCVMVLAYRHYDENLLNRLGWPARMALLGAAAVVLTLAAPEARPFVYFQF